MPESTLTAYQHLVATNRLQHDDEQIRLANRLDELRTQLEQRSQHAKTGGFIKRLINKTPNPDIKGLYIWGGVGRGKTLVMDLFFRETTIERKWRRHFHEFMQDVHQRIFKFRNEQKSGIIPDHHDPIAAVADQIADEVELLCFDEFQISDITDAMILGRLCEALFARHVVIVTTANLPPSELYKDGLNRNLFLPAIKLLEQNLEVLEIDNGADYRLLSCAGEQRYFCPLGPGVDAKLQWMWRQMTGTEQGMLQTLEISGRSLVIPQAIRNIARFHFTDLCAKPLANSDYLELARRYQIIYIEQVPRMTDTNSDFCKRFINMIDTFYDHHTLLVISADSPPDELYTGKRNKFEFSRTASRLVEMQSADYWQKHRF